MHSTKPSRSDRLYGALLRLLPFDFRRDFGSDMEETFREQHAEAARAAGPAGLLHVWWLTVTEFLCLAPREHLGSLVQDVRYALRMMRRNAGFTASAVLILGLGIGVNTAIFSVVNAVLLRPLPYLHGDRLVVLRQPADKLGVSSLGFSPLEVADYRRQSSSLNSLVEYHTMTFTLFGGSEPHRVQTGVVSADFFDFLGVQPLLGRTFVAADDQPGAQPVLVLSYEFWKKSEGGDPRIIGRTYQMNDKPHVVIGVLPPIPQYPNDNDVYMPTSACPFRSSPATISDRNARMLSLFGRLKPEATLNRLTHEVSLIAGRLQREYPKFYPGRLGYTADASLLRENLVHPARPLVWVLVGAAGFVLLIGCANVANLILARMTHREHELAIRMAVGAGGGRLMRQLLTEYFLMAMIAAAFGILLAFAAIGPLTAVLGDMTPRAREISIDGRVLAFAILCAGATTVVFGSVAALASDRHFESALKQTRRSSGDRRDLLRAAMVAAQVAFSFVLLVGAGLMVRSFVRLSQIDPGFAPQRVLAVSFDMNWSTYRNQPAKVRALAGRLLESVRNQPGVLSAAVASSFPMDPDLKAYGGRPQRLQVEGDPTGTNGIAVRSVGVVTPDYFQTLGIPVQTGRTFLDSDDEHTPAVVVVNRSLAVRGWGRQDLVGRRISFDNGGHWLQVIGVVGDVREFGPELDPPLQAYLSMSQNPSPGALLARTAGSPAAVAGLLRRAVRGADRDNAITSLETLDQARTAYVESPRAMARLFGMFAGLALLIAVAGIASMLVLVVQQRTHEFGIRIALGATRPDIVRSVLRRGMVIVCFGLACGMAGALALTGYLRQLLFGIGPTDTATYAGITMLFVSVALVACAVPAYRASFIEPRTALHCD